MQSDNPNPHKFYIELENTSKDEFDKLLSQSWQAVGSFYSGNIYKAL